MADATIITAAVSGVLVVVAAIVAAYANAYVAKLETRRKDWEYRLKRRGERQDTYQAAIDLVTDLPWREGRDSEYDVVRDFSIPFVRMSNRVRIYGSPASIAAMDHIQEGLAQRNRAKNKIEIQAAYEAIRAGLDALVVAAREDVGPRPDDLLKDVPYRRGAGPPA